MLSALLLAEILLLSGATVHSPGAEVPARQADVLLEDGVVVAVGPDLEAPEGARVVDASGAHLIPGLIDGFAYHDGRHDALYTAAGVTLVRDHGNDLARIFRAAEPAAREQARGPTLSISGAVLDGFPPSSSAALVLRSEHEAHAYVPTLIEEGVDFLSVQANLPEASWVEVLKLAHPAEGRTVQVWGPRPKGIDVDVLIGSGQDGLVFLDGLLPPGRTWDEVEAVEFESIVQRAAKSGLRVSPALHATARYLELPEEDDPRLEQLGPQYRALWDADAAQRRESWSPEDRERVEAIVAKQRALLARLHAAGVALVPGSGAPHPWLEPGAGLVDELLEWQRAGLSPGTCLELATTGAEAALELEGRGGLEVGQRPDLVLLERDPREDVANLRSVRAVVLRGRLLERAELDAGRERLLAELREDRLAAERPIEVAPPRTPPGETLLSGMVETRVVGGRIAAERWAIVRGEDDRLHFCGRRVVAAANGGVAVEVEVRQSPKGDRLETFEVNLRTGGRELVVRGQLVANQMRVERRIDGNFVDNKAAREAIAAIDTSSVTTIMLLAHTRGEGALPIIRFDEALELEVVRWDLALEEDGDQWLRTHNGTLFAALREDGALKVAVEQAGAARTVFESVEIDDHGGPGLPLGEERLARMRAARAAEAAAPKDEGEPEPEAGAGGGGD